MAKKKVKKWGFLGQKWHFLRSKVVQTSPKSAPRWPNDNDTSVLDPLGPFLHICLPLIGLKSRFMHNLWPKMVKNVVFSTENLLSSAAYWKYRGKSKILEKFFLSRKSCFYDVGRYFASKSSFWVQMDRFGEKSIFWSKKFFRDFWSKMTPGDPKKSKNIETTRKTSPDIIFGPIATSFDEFQKYDFLYIFSIEADT